MTSTQQRIAIAEACGWTPFNDGTHDMTGHLWVRPGTNYTCGVNHLPDYLHDLNAMHEAEKVLTEQQQATYALYLHGFSGRGPSDFLGKDFDVLHATSAQRAKAFLRTIGKWLDDDANSPAE